MRCRERSVAKRTKARLERCGAVIETPEPREAVSRGGGAGGCKLERIGGERDNFHGLSPHGRIDYHHDIAGTRAAERDEHTHQRRRTALRCER